MTTATLTLTSFLLARIAEDEAVAEMMQQRGQLVVADHHIIRGPIPPSFDPARVLAECEAKRRIVTLMGYVRESWENTHAGEGRVLWPDVNRREKMHAMTILENLAAIYSDHPDYREDWRP